jgi:hypothetical protein
MEIHHSKRHEIKLIRLLLTDLETETEWIEIQEIIDRISLGALRLKKYTGLEEAIKQALSK